MSSTVGETARVFVHKYMTAVTNAVIASEQYSAAGHAHFDVQHLFLNHKFMTAVFNHVLNQTSTPLNAASLDFLEQARHEFNEQFQGKTAPEVVLHYKTVDTFKAVAGWLRFLRATFDKNDTIAKVEAMVDSKSIVAIATFAICGCKLTETVGSYINPLVTRTSVNTIAVSAFEETPPLLEPTASGMCTTCFAANIKTVYALLMPTADDYADSWLNYLGKVPFKIQCKEYK